METSTVKEWSSLYEWTFAISIAVIITAILYFVFWPVRVEGESMAPTLNNGEYIVISQLVAQIQPLVVGEVVVFSYTEHGVTSKLVKRVVAKEGDHVVIQDGKVTVNNVELIEAYAQGATLGNVDLYVPKGSLYVLGDYRSVSKDSRFFGCISKKQVIGKLVLELF